MSAVTVNRMNSLRLARTASLACLAGGTTQIIYGLLAIPFPYGQTAYGWDEVLWALVNIGMIGGAAGLLALDVARPRPVATIGAALTIIGNLIRIVVSVLLVIRPSEAAYVPFILISILLVVLGMTALGITTVLGRRLRGWHSWTPLIAGAFTLLPVATYSINQFVHNILLGLWGVPWILVGYVVFAHAASQKEAVQLEVPGAAMKQFQDPAHLS